MLNINKSAASGQVASLFSNIWGFLSVPAKVKEDHMYRYVAMSCDTVMLQVLKGLVLQSCPRVSC